MKDPFHNLGNLESLGQVVQITKTCHRQLYVPGLLAWTKEGKRRPAYLNFKQIEEFLKRGYEIEVRAYPGDQDITNDILSRVLSKKYNNALKALPKEDLVNRIKSL